MTALEEKQRSTNSAVMSYAIKTAHFELAMKKIAPSVTILVCSYNFCLLVDLNGTNSTCFMISSYCFTFSEAGEPILRGAIEDLQISIRRAESLLHVIWKILSYLRCITA